jgi:hypothetical protein
LSDLFVANRQPSTANRYWIHHGSGILTGTAESPEKIDEYPIETEPGSADAGMDRHRLRGPAVLAAAF